MNIGMVILALCSYFPKVKRCFDFVTRRMAEPIVELVFSVMMKSYIDKDGRKVYTLLNYKIPDIYIFGLFITVLNLLGVASVQFWDNFLFEESHGCTTDRTLYCFRNLPGLNTPRLDCSNTSYLENNNITSVICYRLVLSLGTATGSALGVVTTTALIIYLLTLLILKVSKGKSDRISCSVLSTMLIKIIIALVIIIVTLVLSIYQGIATSTDAKRLILLFKNFSIGYTIAYGTLFFPWCAFEKKEEDQDNYESLP